MLSPIFLLGAISDNNDYIVQKEILSLEKNQTDHEVEKYW